MNAWDREIIGFIRARLVDDLALADAATAGPWEFEGDDPTDDELTCMAEHHVPGSFHVVAYTRHRQLENGRHMERHDPSRVKARLERAAVVVDECEIALEKTEWGHRATFIRWMLRQTAADWAGHPGYKAAWAPGDDLPVLTPERTRAGVLWSGDRDDPF